MATKKRFPHKQKEIIFKLKNRFGQSPQLTYMNHLNIYLNVVISLTINQHELSIEYINLFFIFKKINVILF